MVLLGAQQVVAVAAAAPPPPPPPPPPPGTEPTPDNNYLHWPTLLVEGRKGWGVVHGDMEGVHCYLLLFLCFFVFIPFLFVN